MDNAIEKAIRGIHKETTQVTDYPPNGDEISYNFAVPHCSECRDIWPCMTITVLTDPQNLIDLREPKGKPSGAFVPNPNCDQCLKDEVACITCYMAAGGYND